ncbi:MAG: hypothetical protein Q4F41_15140 [Eubacteriales bacterium]|nr:hypothetical protein [Eubacteriales bacterium]
MGRKERLKQAFLREYGKMPQGRLWERGRTEIYWKELEREIPAEDLVDTVTWNDLEMDQIFERINHCQSFAGEQVLYASLHILEPAEKLQQLEEKIAYFQENPESYAEVLYHLRNIGRETSDYHLPMFFQNLDAFAIRNLWFYRMLQAILVFSAGISVAVQNGIYFLLVFAFNVLVYSMKKMEYEIHLNLLAGLVKLIKEGKKIGEGPYGEAFPEIRSLAKEFAVLSRKIERVSGRKLATATGDFQAMMQDYVLGATFLDFLLFQKIMRLLKGKNREIMEFYALIGETDMAASLASFRKSLPLWCKPTIISDTTVRFEEMYHPLVASPVCNSFQMEKSFLLTGSNASGKSTFLKAAALNLILAQTVHTCMAASAQIPPSQVMTSMAVRDALSEGESYYIREIRYLKRMFDRIGETRFAFLVIDEILRGTNTRERIQASEAILRFLSENNCLVLAATHDVELTESLDGPYQNMHFEETFREGDIVFPYRLMEGPSASSNAILLLKAMGFPNIFD